MKNKIFNAAILILMAVLVYQNFIKGTPDDQAIKKIIKATEAQSKDIEKAIADMEKHIEWLNIKITAQKYKIEELSKKDSVISVNLKSYTDIMAKLDERLERLKDSQGDPVSIDQFNSDVFTLSHRLGRDISFTYPNIILKAGELRYENALILKFSKYKDMYDTAKLSSDVRGNMVNGYIKLSKAYELKLKDRAEEVKKLKTNVGLWKDNYSNKSKLYSSLKKKSRRRVVLAAIISLAMGIIISK